ncbi:hypothetical protein ABPG75_012650 [Micractinium tetrahymenae]
MAAASCSGRVAQAACGAAYGQRPFRQSCPRQRPPCGSRAVRAGDLEEEFKKRALGMFSDSSSGGLSQERLKELNASRLGGAAADLSSSSGGGGSPAGGPVGPAAQHPQQAGLQPPHPDSSQQRAEDPAGPFSTHLPLSHEPYHPLEFYPTSQFELDWGAPGAGAEPWLGPGGGDRSRCFVILFGVGRAETEGIYSLRAVAKDDGLPVDTIVAFENEDDAVRYSTLLEATMDHEPTVWPIEWGELLEFCNSAGYRCRLEPAGSLLIPPDYNVGMTDWEKSLKLRRGEFGVLGEQEAAPAPAAMRGLALDAAAAGWGWAAEELPQDEEEMAAAELNARLDAQLRDPSELDRLRQHLEGLLPHD